MERHFPDGVWPVMLTPFTKDDAVDYEALAQLIEWYIGRGANGLFAVCQSSEMFRLSRNERMTIAWFVKKQARGRVPVVASGHVSGGFDSQVEDILAIAAQKVDAVVLVTNRIGKITDSDQIWKRNMEMLLKSIPEDIPLGLYECPYPYKWILSPELLKWCAETGRFHFLKDTSCDVENIRKKLLAVKDTDLKIYNANAATLLETLKLGVSGYSGIMTNFHPELYRWLFENWSIYPDIAEKLEGFLSISSLIEKQIYPVNAKYGLTLHGLKMGLFTRTQDVKNFTVTHRLEIEQLYQLTSVYKKIINIPG